MQKERFFALKRPFKHPYMTYEVGTNYSASMWAERLGHRMKVKEFIKLVETDDRFKQYFRETTGLLK